MMLLNSRQLRMADMDHCTQGTPPTCEKEQSKQTMTFDSNLKGQETPGQSRKGHSMAGVDCEREKRWCWWKLQDCGGGPPVLDSSLLHAVLQVRGLVSEQHITGAGGRVAGCRMKLPFNITYCKTNGPFGDTGNKRWVFWDNLKTPPSCC